MARAERLDPKAPLAVPAFASYRLWDRGFRCGCPSWVATEWVFAELEGEWVGPLLTVKCRTCVVEVQVAPASAGVVTSPT